MISNPGHNIACGWVSAGGSQGSVAFEGPSVDRKGSTP